MMMGIIKIRKLQYLHKKLRKQKEQLIHITDSVERLIILLFYSIGTQTWTIFTKQPSNAL